MFGIFKKKQQGKYEKRSNEPVPQKNGDGIRIRHHIEHNYFPDQFFKHPDVIVGVLLSENGGFEFYQKIYSALQGNLPYRKEEFHVDAVKIDEDNRLILLGLPGPECVPLCYRVYFLFNRDFTKKAYFTIEKGMTGGFLCQWNESGAHINLGKINHPELEQGQKNREKSLEMLTIIDHYQKLL